MKLGGAQLKTHQKRQEAPASFGAKFLLAVAIIVTLGCAVGYVMEMNKATSTGYEIKSLEKAVVGLRSENAKLSAALAELQSMAVKEQKINMMGMIDVGQVEFVTQPGPVAVLR